MRLILADQPDNSSNTLDASHPYANYLIDIDDNYKELKVPSGLQTGIKIVKGFAIVASQATELILDFDAAKSVVQGREKREMAAEAYHQGFGNRGELCRRRSG
jgi:hypothetical protein